MSELNWDLDELVRSVMADLRAVATASPGAALSDALSRDFQSVRSAADPEASKDSELVLDAAVLVVDDVERLLKETDAKVWRARPTLVATPSALDALARAGVVLMKGEKTLGAPGRSPGSRVRATISSSNAIPAIGRRAAAVGARKVDALLAVHSSNEESVPSFLVEAMTSGSSFTERKFDCLKKTTRAVSDALNENGALKVVISTREVAIASIWANRYKGVRAVVARSIDQARRDIAATNANAIIVDPSELGAYRARNVVDFFLRFESKKAG